MSVMRATEASWYMALRRSVTGSILAREAALLATAMVPEHDQCARSGLLSAGGLMTSVFTFFRRATEERLRNEE